jgi:hypothetical protein
MTNNQKIYFITYGNRKFKTAKKHLINLANHSNFFTECISMSPRDLNNNFVKKYTSILAVERGAGYWIWKYEIINNLLKKINTNDLVVYCDAGGSLNFHARKRFYEYIDIINSSKFGNFRIECESNHIENQWTSQEVFNYFDLDVNSHIGKSTQLEAGHMIFKKNAHSISFFEEFDNILNYDQNLITDKYNHSKQIDTFKECRHDQSIFSIISKKFGCEYIKNETEFKNRAQEQYSYPFLSVRQGGHGIKDKTKFFINYKSINTKPIYFEE